MQSMLAMFELTSNEWAAWIHTVGSLVALVAAFFIVGMQSRVDRQGLVAALELRRAARLKTVIQLVGSVQRIAKHARDLARIAPDPDDAARQVERIVSELNIVGDALRRFDLTQLTSDTPIEAILVAGSLSRELARKIAESAGEGGSAGVRDSVEILDLASSELEERVNRLCAMLRAESDQAK